QPARGISAYPGEIVLHGSQDESRPPCCQCPWALALWTVGVGAQRGSGTRMNLPTTMQAIGIAEPGGPDVLRLEERPLPMPGPGQVLIEVACAGVNRPDVLQRLGRYPPPSGASDVPGLEISGTV